MSYLIEKLARRDHLTDAERRALVVIMAPPRSVAARQDIVSEHDRPSHSTLLISGFAGRYVTLPDGRRQITEISVPGDFVDLHSLLMKQMDHGVVALTDATVANAPHDRLRRLTETHPHLTRLLWLDTVIDGAIHRQLIASMGRKTGLGQLAHLVAELYVRLEVVGLASELSYDLPLSQAVIGDALGLSAVHVSRLVGELRDRGILDWTQSRVTILSWPRLIAAGDFDPTYLRLQREPV
jgi:CRP-like cAMP-binding protein